MSKQIKFEHNGTEYKLEYTKRTVTEMEKRGFVASDIEKKPMTMLPALFEGAFLANHRFVKKDVIDEIFNVMGNKEDLVGKLAEMYAEPILSLLEEPKDKKGNVTWTASF